MILVKTPFRVSLIGGGTDLPEFFRRHGHGAVVSGAIDKYMYVMIHPYFHDKLRIKYSQTEDVDRVEELQHPIVRECLKLMSVTSGLEIASIADIPAGLGLGSSSSFTVCLLHALAAREGRYVTKRELAERACEVEIERLGEPIGKQDQYAASHGGLCHLRFNADGTVEREDLMLDPDTTRGISDRLLIFYIGAPRAARDILSEQRDGIRQGQRYEAARRLVDLADAMRRAIRDRQLQAIGDLLHEGWTLKKTLSKGITNTVINEVYDRARAAGASGGKLLGAGGGGFMLFYCEPDRQAELREALQLRELHYGWDRAGSRVIYDE